MDVPDETGHLFTTVIIPFPQQGDYRINVSPKPGASPTDTYTIEVTKAGTTTVLVQDQQVQDIPSDPLNVVVPMRFASFDIHKASIKLDEKRTDKNRFEMRGSFVLAEISNGAAVLNEDVIVKFSGPPKIRIRRGLSVRRSLVARNPPGQTV